MDAPTAMARWVVAILFGLTLLPSAQESIVPPSFKNDWRSRINSKDVVRYWDFDSQEKSDPFIRPAWGKTEKNGRIVTDVVADGTGALQFTVPSQSSADAAGSFAMNFSDDYSVQFGQGEEFYVQYKVRYNEVILRTKYKESAGFKMHILGEGDRPGAVANSCTPLELVLQNSNQRGYPTSYHSCGVKDGNYEPIQFDIPNSYDYLDQSSAGCLHYEPAHDPPCLMYRPNEWMTIQVHVKVGTWYLNDKKYHRDSTYEVWAAHEKQPSRLIISLADYDIVNEDPNNAKYGKIWLLPYQTNKDAKQVTGTGYVWYDDMIISRHRIPDPEVGVPNAPDSLKVRQERPREVDVIWRNNSRDESGFKIERCNGPDRYCYFTQRFKEIGTAAAGSSSYIDREVKSGSTYTYRVRAFNGDGLSAFSGGVCWNQSNPCYGTITPK